MKNEPAESKFKGQGRYVVIIVDGQEHNLKLENTACEEAMTGLTGLEVELTASGRDDSAEILATPLGDGQAPARQTPPPRQQASRAPAKPPARQQAKPPAQSQQAPPPPQQQAAKPPAKTSNQRTPAQALLEAKLEAARYGNLLLVAYGAAIYVKEQLKEQRGIELNDQTVQVDAAKIFIDLKMAGYHRDIGTHPIDIRPKQKTATQPTK